MSLSVINVFFSSCLCIFLISHLISTVILLISLPDIPLSSLEEKKSEHLRLLQKRISRLKQQVAGDCRPPGNMAKYTLYFKYF